MTQGALLCRAFGRRLSSARGGGDGPKWLRDSGYSAGCVLSGLCCPFAARRRRLCRKGCDAALCIVIISIFLLWSAAGICVWFFAERRVKIVLTYFYAFRDGLCCNLKMGNRV